MQLDLIESRLPLIDLEGDNESLNIGLLGFVFIDYLATFKGYISSLDLYQDGLILFL